MEALRITLVLVLAVVLGACSHAQPKPGTPPGATSSPAEAYGPPEPNVSPTPPPQPEYGPELARTKPVVLVLSPGLARGFAHAGALRALAKAKIPIGAVLGAEMGGLLGGLYAVDGSINHFEWALLKLNEDTFLDSGVMSYFKKTSDGKALENALEKMIPEGRDVSQTKVPLELGLELRTSDGKGAAQIIERGLLVDALRAEMSNPAILQPGEWDGREALSSEHSRPYLVKEARALGLGPVIVIDVMSDADRAAAPGSEGELKDADLVIRPDLTGFAPMDFKKKTELAYRGAAAVRAQMAAIRKLVGLPDEGETSQ